MRHLLGQRLRRPPKRRMARERAAERIGERHGERVSVEQSKGSCTSLVSNDGLTYVIRWSAVDMFTSISDIG